MSEQPQPRETPDEWAARMVREHGSPPMRIGRRLAHLFEQQQAKAAQAKQANKTGH